MRIIIIGIINILILASCGNQPKVIVSQNEGTTENESYNTSVFGKEGSETTKQTMVDGDVHTVVIKEVLPTDKYIYLHVEEEGKEFWIATRKQEVQKGGTYHYKGGLLKRNFESKEYDRVFEEVYLVGNIVPSGHGMDQNGSIQPDSKVENTTSIQKKEGSIDIAEIVNNPEKFEGKEVLVSGVCTKLNANIMGRNWIHLKDGSMDDYDFVITSDVAVPEGHSISLLGTVTRNKDFGAGYRYDLILENGRIAQ